ncbi:MAG: hypothetical protein ABJC13_23110 [Acidobacteriota bacterium]
MKDGYDFSKGERGKFHSPDPEFVIPVYFEPDVIGYLSERAEAKCVEVEQLTNDILRRDIALVEAVKCVANSARSLTMAHPRYSSHEIAERGQTLYEREICGALPPSARGSFLVVDIETGAYEMDPDELAAVKRARANHLDGAFFVLRVGHSAAFRLRHMSLRTASVVGC